MTISLGHVISIVTILVGVATLIPGSALSGTWHCMGELDHAASGSAGTVNGATLWLRISR